ncbi:MAG: tRNA-dihydrouridine synthase [Alphaproteobacteria bacterium]|nr:tRNA-dihydrouridine synthase [Alphaproteobacteria bacterium]
MIPLIAAPMAGVTDKPFRQMIRHFGLHTLYTEMIAVESLRRNHPATRKMMDIWDEENIIIQFVGINQDSFIAALPLAEEVGAVGIDINMGCPVKKLISNGSGSALLKTPDVAARLVEAVKKNTRLPVSVKMRIGWDTEHINGVSFAKTLESAGADKIMVHARTKSEGYAGIPHYDTVSEIKENLHIPVFVNGNITDLKSLKNALDITGADGALIGRGLLGKPWLLSEIETGKKPIFNLADIALQHFELLMNYYGKHGLFIARKHLAWYMKGQKNVAEFCQRVYAEENADKVRQLIQQYLGGNA